MTCRGPTLSSALGLANGHDMTQGADQISERKTGENQPLHELES